MNADGKQYRVLEFETEEERLAFWREVLLGRESDV